ncbi:MAG: hypothetical protein HQK55_13380 [Deltaproteobacteria bacterium]|nr:hypothetical protein [Deltaproteobacteria bacterium]
MAPPEEVACCGSPPSPPSSALERPGYQLWPFVDSFLETPAGSIPQVKTKWIKPDYQGTLLARVSPTSRNDYKIAPGLYAVGQPGAESPVLVTANYKLTFDTLRRELSGLRAWILVLDTRGINVWCAAGKKLFSTDEIIRRVKLSRLDQLVSHRRLILPQLGATGVSAHQVKKDCGFEVIWGPIRAADVKRFVEAGFKAETGMRQITFSLWERLILTPVELSLAIKPFLWAVLAAILISGIGPHIFSLNAAWSRGLAAISALLVGVLCGTVIMPALLPWTPTPAFSQKGAIIGGLGGALMTALTWSRVGLVEHLALMVLTIVISSFLAMNFTGSTPFTSPTGVEKEMRQAIPWQIGGLLVSVVVWIGAAFMS